MVEGGGNSGGKRGEVVRVKVNKGRVERCKEIIWLWKCDGQERVKGKSKKEDSSASEESYGKKEEQKSEWIDPQNRRKGRGS